MVLQNSYLPSFGASGYSSASSVWAVRDGAFSCFLLYRIMQRNAEGKPSLNVHVIAMWIPARSQQYLAGEANAFYCCSGDSGWFLHGTVKNQEAFRGFERLASEQSLKKHHLSRNYFALWPLCWLIVLWTVEVSRKFLCNHVAWNLVYRCGLHLQLIVPVGEYQGRAAIHDSSICCPSFVA